MDSTRFFANPPAGRPGLALFLVAGDPPLEQLRELLALMDDQQVDCLELAIPFPGSASDGPVIRDSATRALERGIDTGAVLALIEEVRPSLSHLKIALLADWSYSIKGTPMPDFLERVKASGADGLLVHGLPPLVRKGYYEAARAAGQPIVTTCYATSKPEVLEEAAENGSAYIYLVASYGRSGTVGPPDPAALVPVIDALRAKTDVPVAVGFGVKDRTHIEELRQIGADAAIVGSACVARVAAAQAEGRDVVRDFGALLADLGAAPEPMPSQKGVG